MRLGNFAVEVSPGRESASGYVAMDHNTKYVIKLTNLGSPRCDAEVMIDGKEVGTWRVPAGNSIVLERPVNDTGRFTFCRLGTPEADRIGLVRDSKLGLISVLFKPESEYLESDLRACQKPGGTGLSGRSDQMFRQVRALTYDKSAFVQIHLRLICDDEQLRPLIPISSPVPPPLNY